MSIIERVAELLESVPRIRQEPLTRSGEAGDFKQGLIEGAIGHLSDRRDQSEDKPARPRGRTAKTLRVDWSRLQRQNMVTPGGERTTITESFQRVKRQILTNAASRRSGAPPANLVMVTSALAGEGKTFCAINLSISIAMEVDRTVLLVDADTAKPGIPQALGIEAKMGLMDVLLDRRVDLSDVLLKTNIERLTLLPAGMAHKHATEQLASDAMRKLLHEIAERYHDRIVVFDSPPLLAVSEAEVLASQMGQIVVVVEAAKTSEAALKDALNRIDSDRVTGLLLNKGESHNLGYGYGYGYGYGSNG